MLNSSIRRLNSENSKAVAGSRELQTSHRHLMDTAGQLARRMALIFSVSQIQGYINNIIRVRGEFELQNRALQAIIQNKAEADKLFGQIATLAVKSPFQLRELITYTKQLSAYRVETEKLYDTTKMLADVSAGLGIDMNRLILAFGQVKAANYLRGQELRQFSEAGINILGELADYFTELNGKIVTTGDVFEMVSKRMVTFGDIEKIFQKLTSEGGIFYNMQEIQAETLAGQISNLRDSLDIMFNEIGKANEGTLKDSVALVRSFIENWQVLKGVITFLIEAFIAYKLYALGAKQANIILAESFNIVAVGATKQLSVLQLFQLGFKSLTSGITEAKNAMMAFMSANAWLLAIAVIIKGLYEIATWNDKYDEQVREINKKLYEQKKVLNDIVYAYEKLNKKEDEDTYSNKVDELKKLQSYINESGLNIPINLEKIDKENIDEVFNEVTEQITKIKDIGAGIGMAIAKGFSGKEGNILGVKFLGENLKSDLQDLDDAYSEISGGMKYKMEAAINEIAERYDQLPDSARRYYDEIKKGQKEDETEEQFLYRKIRLLSYIRDMIYMTGNQQLETTKIITELETKRLKILGQETEAREEINKVIERIQKQFGVKDFASLPENIKINLKPEIDKAFESMQLSEQTKRMAAYWIAHPLAIPYSLTPQKDGADKELSWLSKQINAYIGKNKIDVPLVTIDDESADAYLAKIKEERDTAQKEIDRLSDKKLKPQYEGISNEDKIKELKAFAKERTKIIDAYLGEERKKTLSKDPEEEKWKNRIELLKKANSEYEKLNKVLSKTEAIDKVNKIMAKEFKSAGMMDRQGVLKYRIDYDRKATLDNIKSLSEEAGAKYAQYFEKEISPMETDLFIDAKLVDVDIVQRELADAFSGYELSVEIDKTGIPKGWIEDMFGVKSINFNGLTKKVNDIIKKARTYKDQLTGKEVYVETEDETIMRVSKEMYGKSEEEKTKRLKEELITRAELQKNLSLEDIKLSEDANKKLDDIARKTINDRMKTYEQLINNSRTIEDKIAEIERNGEIERMLIRKDFEGKNEMYMNQLLKASKDAQDKSVADLRDTAFKSTDIYQEMFGDIQSYGDYTINYLINKAKEMTKPFDGSTGVQFIKNERGEDKVSISYRNEKDEIVQTNISMEVYLSLLKQIQNLQNEFGNTSIFKNSIRDWAKYNDLAKERERIEKEFGRNSKEYQRASANLWKALGKAISSTGDDMMNIISSFQFLSELMGEAGDTALQSMFAVGQAAIAVAEAIKTAERSSVIIAIIQAALVTVQAVMSLFDSENERITQQIATLEGELKQLEYWEKRVSKNTFTDVNQLPILKQELELRRQIYKERILNNEKFLKYMSADIQKKLIEAAYGMDSLATVNYGMPVNAKVYRNARKALTYVNAELEYMKGLSEIIASNFDDMQKSIAALGLSYEKQIANIDAQINAEMSRSAKKIDWDKIQDLEDQKFELMQKNLLKWADAIKENFGDIFEELSSNIAQSFMDAFENVTDPAKAFEESWDKAIKSMLTNMFKIQYMQPLLKKWMEEFNVAMGLNPDGTAKQANGKDVIPDMVLTEEEAAELKKQYDAIKDSALGAWQQFSDIFDELGIMAGGEAQMSGLQQGIEGITEDTAQALEALLNSMRFFVSDSNQVLKNFYNAFTSQDAKVNPILAELKAQTEQIRLINSFLTSIGKSGHPQGGQGIKVFLN